MIDGPGRHSVDQPAAAREVSGRDASTPPAPDDAVTEVIPVVVMDSPERERQPGPAPESRLTTNGRHRRRTRLRRVAVFAGIVIAVLGIAYAIDWFASSGKVPRGVTVAGVDVGGRSQADALAVLKDRIGARAGQPVVLQAGDVRTELVPSAAGLDVAWDETLDRIGSQPIDPVTRVTSFFSTRNVDVVSAVDDAALTRAVDGLRAKTDRPAVEGTVAFEGAAPVAVTPVNGQTIDVADAKTALIDHWADGAAVDLPVTTTTVTVGEAAVDRAIRDVAVPALAGDFVFTGKNGMSATLRPDQTGTVLAFAPDGSGGLTPQIKRDVAIGLLAPQLASTEIQPKDAEISVASGTPQVLPAVVGDLVRWQQTLDRLPALLTAPLPRTIAVVYEPVQPKLTTEAANALGINEVIGEYTTGGFESASGVNIRKVATVVDGAVVKPGDTFSLNDFTGPRGIDQGYVESGIIDDGRPQRAVGGGISQFATTLYNATYFAGLEDVTHTEHSYFITRYPEAREATVFEGAIDLVFKNNAESGILIESFGTSSNVTVRIWGNKTVDVESVTGDRFAETEPQPLTLPKGEDCVPSNGAPGFTTSNTRIITDHVTGEEVYRHTRTVKYDAVPIVKCE